MKKTITKIILASLIAMTSVFAEYKEVKKDLFNDISILNQYGIGINKAYDTGAIYHLKATIKGKIQDVFLTKDKKVIFLGAAYDTTNGQKMSIPVDMNKYISKKAFTYGTGSDEFVVFTDPECPYCSKFESYWEEIKDKVKFHIFFLPLDFHKNAKDMTYYILSKKTDDDKMKALSQIGKGSKEYLNSRFTSSELEKLQAQLKEQMNIANELSARGTPTIFDMDGKTMSWPDVLKRYGVNVK